LVPDSLTCEVIDDLSAVDGEYKMLKE